MNANNVKPPFFSIVVPVYNVEAYLGRCVESVVSQTFPDWELVLVDDGSTDSSPSMCDAVVAGLPGRARVIHQGNAGLLIARRVGMGEARGDVVVSLDSDDMLRGDALERIHGAFARNGVDMVVYGYSRRPDFGGLKGPGLAAEDGVVGRARLQEAVCSTFSMNPMWSKAVRRDLVDLDADYSPYAGLSVGEDLLQTLPIIDKTERAFYIHDALYFYRPNPASLTHVFELGHLDDIDEVYSVLRRYATAWDEEVSDLVFSKGAATRSSDAYACAIQRIVETFGYREAHSILMDVSDRAGFRESISIPGAMGGLRADRRLAVRLLVSSRFSALYLLQRTKALARRFVKGQ